MAIPETMRSEIEGKLTRYCGDVPERVKDKLRLEFTIRGNSVTIFESRPVFQKPDVWTHTHVAQFRYDPGTKGWTLYAADRNGRWHDYTSGSAGWDGSITDFDGLLDEVERDPTGIFWG